MMRSSDRREAPPASASQLDYYSSGQVRGWVPSKPWSACWAGVRLIAQYEEEAPRRVFIPPVCFHQDGSLKSLTLQTPVILPTPVGPLPAERITFHSNGALRRVFPTAGKPHATWTDADEREHSPIVHLDTPIGVLETRLIGACFYAGGQLRSLTLWPGETVALPTPLGTLPARIGIAFHQSGTLRSFEPGRPLTLPTPVGDITAFNALAVGIHGDANSVEFTPRGQLATLLTETCRIELLDANGEVVAHHGPGEIPSRCEEEATEKVPLRIEFDRESLILDGKRYPRATHTAIVHRPPQNHRQLPMLCSSC